MQKTLRQRAFDLLSRREHSRAELTRKLSPYAENSIELSRLLDEFTQQGWQSDERFAEQYIHMRSTKYGMQRIAQELRQRGIADTIIHKANIQTGETESAAYTVAYSQWTKKFGTQPTTQQERAKQIRFLISRGFNQQIIQRILKGDIPEIDNNSEFF